MSTHIGSLPRKARAVLADGFAWRYGVGGLAVLLALSFRLLLFPVLGAHSPYLPFALAVIVAARFGGRGSGFAATALSALAVAWFFLEPEGFAVGDRFAIAGLALFVIVGFLISLLVGNLRELLLSTARAEEALRRKTQLVDLSHDAIITADSSRRITGWNTGAAEMYGWTEGEALGRVLHELVQNTDPKSPTEIEAILLRSERWDGELNHTARDGRQIVVESRQVLLRGARNQPVGILEINRDVTERMRAEQELRASERQYRALFETIQEGFVVGEVLCDAAGNPIDWRYLEVNPAMASMLGRNRNEILGRTCRELFPEARWQYWVNGFGKVGLTGTPARLDQHGGGTGRHYDAIAYSPAPGQFAAILTDITERKETEQALARQRQQYETLAENAPEIIARFDAELRHVYINDYGAKVYGLPKSKILGKSNEELGFPADKVAFWKEHFCETFATGKQGTVEFEFDSPNLGHQHLSSLFVPEADEHGNVGSILAITRDVTALRQAELRLRQSQKLECIGVLAGGVAHDFNNLLTVIMGSASSALAECPSCEHSQAILAASDRAAYLTKQLLAYAGKGQAVVKIIDLTEVVSETAGLLSASVPKRVALNFELANNLPCLEADPSQIEQLLMNLVINAGEAIRPRMDGRIDVATSACEVTPAMVREYSQAWDLAPGPYVCLEVRDNGIGMDEATMSRIFDPFFSTKFTGRGLGLAALQGIVRASKGFIDVHSKPGNGTTFRIYLPASANSRRAAPEVRALHQQIRGSSTILVVDDEAMVRRLACVTLRRSGYEVLEATDGKEALAVLAASPSLPSVVLLDLAMPVMGGDELAPILQQMYPGMKIIISSGYPEEEARRGFSAVSVAGFLQKPYTGMTLVEKVGEIGGAG